MMTMILERYPELSSQRQQSRLGAIQKALDTAVQDDHTNGARGASHWVHGSDAAAEAIGLKPLMSAPGAADEGHFLVQHKFWRDAIRRGLSADTGVDAKEQDDVVNA
jgi:hypothetical protein